VVALLQLERGHFIIGALFHSELQDGGVDLLVGADHLQLNRVQADSWIPVHRFAKM
jgi:hypothetical protein